MTDLGRSLALAHQMRDQAALIRKMDEIVNAVRPVQSLEATARRLDAGAAEIERLANLADKYKWQVRDTCTRAENAEAALPKATPISRKAAPGNSALVAQRIDRPVPNREAAGSNPAERANNGEEI